jgi:hypothetical protein
MGFDVLGKSIDAPHLVGAFRMHRGRRLDTATSAGGRGCVVIGTHAQRLTVAPS